MRAKQEYELSRAISTYCRLQYPNIIFHFDLAGLNLSRAQAGMTKAIQGKRGFPDLFLAEPRKQYHGMFLELKRVGEKVFLKNGSVSKIEHIQEQYKMLTNLRARGFYAQFAIGFDDAKKQIDEYLNYKL